MGNDYYKQREGKDRFAQYGEDGYEHRGKAEYGEDGHMTRLDIISPVSGESAKHHHEWWNEKDGYGHEIHDDHKSEKESETDLGKRNDDD